MMLPGSNLTNLIVLGHLHLSGGSFLAHMAVPTIVAAFITAVVVGAWHHGELRTTIVPSFERVQPVLGVGAVAIAAVTVLVVALRAPAIPVAAVGAGAALIRFGRSRSNTSLTSLRKAAGAVGLPVLVGLLGVAIALGTLGRSWSGPATLLSHLDTWGTAVLAALISVLVNNLPAASLLAARRPPHPFSLLVGLNIGPNLFATGSLAWVLWLRAAKAAGGRVELKKAGLLGLVSAPLAIAGAVGVLVAQGLH
jgi:arsenical pump membrane protein